MVLLNIVALCIYLFGAYAYGSVVVLCLRHRTVVWSPNASPASLKFDARVQSLAMFVACTVWFVLHAIIGFRALMGDPGRNDLVDLAALELVFLFPGLIFHTVLLESGADADGRPRTAGRWSWVLASLYAAGLAMALYFPAVIFDVIPGPANLGPYVGIGVGALFSMSSAFCIAVMVSRPRASPTSDQRRLRSAMLALFATMILVFFVLSFMRERQLLINILDAAVRMTPLAFLLVSVYFENRIEFYDLVIKRGVLLLLSLAILVGALATTLGWLDGMPEGPTRAVLFAVVLLPMAMLMPWLHSGVGRWLDRMWFGREFTPVEAVKHVLSAMQQAADEATLVSASQATLSEIFRRPVRILADDHQIAEPGMTVTEIRMPEAPQSIRIAVPSGRAARPMLSEDFALLRSLGGVFGFMLENVRLQRRRQEHEQVAQELRLQTSRSELKALRAQINPHFLFNALNAIASLIHTDPARADAAVEQLAEVFRYTLRRSDQEWAPLDQELAFARAYLDVEQARFGRRLDFAIAADPASNRALVPSMLLQTLVENAVKHGIARLRTPGRIDIRTSRADHRLTLEVRDTGPGLEASGGQPASVGESFGLRSVRDRLQGHFGADASLELIREDGTTVARIGLPFIDQSSQAAGVER